jgi:PAS domain S-box-containing protein
MKYGNMTREQMAEELSQAHQMISDLKKQVSSLKKTLEKKLCDEEKVRLHFSLTKDVMFTYDLNLKVLSVSPNVERILGFKPEEIVGKNFYDLGILHPEDLSEAVEDALSILSGRTMNYDIHRFFTKDGEIKFGELSRIPFKRNGRVVEVISVARDISDRIEREKKLKESQETAKALLDVSSDTSMLLDISGNVIAINEPAARRFGKKAKDLLGANIFQEIPEDASSRIQASFVRLIRTVKPVQLVAEPQGKPLSIRMYPIRDLHGKVTRVAVNAKKVTAPA